MTILKGNRLTQSYNKLRHIVQTGIGRHMHKTDSTLCKNLTCDQ